MAVSRDKRIRRNLIKRALSTGILRSSAKGCQAVIGIGARSARLASIALDANEDLDLTFMTKHGRKWLFFRVGSTTTSTTSTYIRLGGIFEFIKNTLHPVTMGLRTGKVGDPHYPRRPQKMKASRQPEIQKHPLLTAKTPVLILLDLAGKNSRALYSLEEKIRENTSPRIMMKIHLGKQSESLDLLSKWGFRIFVIDDEGSNWGEISAQRVPRQNLKCMKSQIVYCVKKDKSVSLASFLHSGLIGGSELSHSEFAVSHISHGGMIATYLPEGEDDVRAHLVACGSSVYSYPTSFGWWAKRGQKESSGPKVEDFLRDSKVQSIEKSVRDMSYDLALSQTSVFAAGAQIATNTPLPHIWWIREFGDLDHGFEYPLPPEQMGDVFKKYSSLILANSQAVAKHFFPLGEDKVQVSSPVPRVGVLKKPRIPVGRFSLGLVGNVSKGKGHELAIRSIAVCRGKGFTVHLKMIGPAHSENVEPLLALATELGVAASVEFTGPKLGLDEIYADISAVVVASNSEAWGRVAFEATAEGLPVIYARSGGALEYMVENETGLAFEPGNIIDLAEKIELLVKSHELGGQLVSKAQEKLFSLEESSTTSAALYERLLALREVGQIGDC